MGIAVLEAMHAGLPVIASDIPAMQGVLGNTGLLVPAENSSALSKSDNPRPVGPWVREQSAISWRRQSKVVSQ